MVKVPIPVHTVKASDILEHVGRMKFKGTALHFSIARECRYDDPQQVYGVLYLGFNLSTALMESVFHKHHWDRLRSRTISRREIRQRLVRIVGVMDDLRLAHITSAGTMAPVLGLNLNQLTSRRYGPTMRLSRYVYQGLDQNGQAYDGIYYPSRNNYPEHCVALFSRTANKIALIKDIDLARHRDWPGFLSHHRVAVL